MSVFVSRIRSARPLVSSLPIAVTLIAFLLVRLRQDAVKTATVRSPSPGCSAPIKCTAGQ